MGRKSRLEGIVKGESLRAGIVVGLVTSNLVDIPQWNVESLSFRLQNSPSHGFLYSRLLTRSLI